MTDHILHNLFSTEAGVFWLVLKWVLVVLAAGFIGQFGKALASHLIRRAQERKRREGAGTAEHRAPPAAGPVPAAPEAPAVPEAPADGPVTSGSADVADAERKAREKAQKKALKAQQKAEKKARKGIEKLLQ